MRLNEKEIKCIINSFYEVLENPFGALYLFGSRVDNAKKGGDIDLLLITPEEYLSHYRSIKSRISHAIQDRIGEQKIDITVVSADQMKNDEFLLSLTDKILIHNF